MTGNTLNNTNQNERSIYNEDTAATQAHAQPASALAHSFCLGDWQVCPALNRIDHRRESEQRQLEPRLIHLLCYLAANPNRVLTREQLVQELWPKVVVNENSLTRAMSELRKHLLHRCNTTRIYIETIPKKGYRLLPVPEAGAVPPESVSTPDKQQLSWVRMHISPLQTVAAMCLSLAVGLWLGLGPLGILPSPADDQILLSDELVKQPTNYYGGELTLSTADESTVVGNGIKSVDAPVISNDQSQYAYIQHDNSGSTIFLGRLDALTAPVVAVYNSPDKLFNLTWSPLGHRLIFAHQAKLASAALFPDDHVTADLMSLDLTTMDVQRLVPDPGPAQPKAVKPHNLT